MKKTTMRISDLKNLYATLPQPGHRYRSLPFWAWNAKLDPDELRRQMADMRDKGIGGAFAHSRDGLETPYLSELVAGLGNVPCTPEFAMLSTDEVPESVVPYLPDHNAVLLANHGALAWGGDLWEAFDRMETVEHTARIVWNARVLGNPVALTEDQVARLRSMQGMYRKLREVRRPE